MIFFTFIEMLPLFITICLFPVNNGFVDVSDVPIYFIEMAKKQLETVDFLESSEQIQSKKNKISNLIYYSLDFVKIDKERQYLDYMNFCYTKCNGLLSEYSIKDIRFRANGLYEKMNTTLTKINHMNCLEDKNEIITDLELYLKVIDSKDLSEIEAVDFVTKESSLDRKLNFFFHKVFLPVILVIVARLIWLFAISSG